MDSSTPARHWEAGRSSPCAAVSWPTPSPAPWTICRS